MLASIAHAESSSSSATSSVINVQLPTAADAQNVMGSIMGVDATATSYYLTCPTDTSSTDCSLGDGFELVEGPSVLAIHMTESALGYGRQNRLLLPKKPMLTFPPEPLTFLAAFPQTRRAAPRLS